MEIPPKRIAVTGGAGHIAYSLLFKLASGDVFGQDQPVILQILEIPQALGALEGVKMELQDCAFSLLKEIIIGTDPHRVFQDADYAFLIGAKPRGAGMKRSDLLAENGKIFAQQGKALNAVANPGVKVLVIGNPCNTNCLIAMTKAPNIPRKNFHAMSRLDQNRATFQLANKVNVNTSEVTRLTIWGNHSSTQVPDFLNAKISGRPAVEMIPDRSWFTDDFIPTVQKRGSAVIAARGSSSAASAANAASDALRSIVMETPEGHWYSSGVCSDDNPYGIEEDLIFSFPCQTDANNDYAIVAGLKWDNFLKERIEKSMQELKEERSMVKNLLRDT